MALFRNICPIQFHDQVGRLSFIYALGNDALLIKVPLHHACLSVWILFICINNRVANIVNYTKDPIN